MELLEADCPSVRLTGSRPQHLEEKRRPVTLTCGLVRAQTGDGWRELPTWQEQLTLRMFGWSFVVGVPFTVIILKLSLTAGIIPGMAIPITIIGWATLMWWVRAAQRCGFRGTRPFTVMVRPCLGLQVAAAGLVRCARGGAPVAPHTLRLWHVNGADVPLGRVRVSHVQILIESKFYGQTLQENTLFQTCCGSISGVAFTGGFGMYLTAMSRTVYLASAGVAGNNPNVRTLALIGSAFPSAHAERLQALVYLRC